jgi:uncharacterized protein (DUF2235 family)
LETNLVSRFVSKELNLLEHFRQDLFKGIKSVGTLQTRFVSKELNLLEHFRQDFVSKELNGKKYIQ